MACVSGFGLQEVYLDLHLVSAERLGFGSETEPHIFPCL